ncbi:MAG: autotransporter domain-containing protein [Armatimonadetes bacterium]|nr:autotransporter domain-containing protein [Armatimonadota bacterium]
MLLAAVAAGAQIEDQLSAYTGDNAEGYLEPLARAIGANLNSGLFHSAYVPEEGFHISLETPVMAVMFSDDDATFKAVPTEGFTPSDGSSEFDAPTIVGSGEAQIVHGEGGATLALPGGLDLASFTLAMPQVRIGSFRGTEALIRYIGIDAGDSEIGKASLFGIGARHNISQYMTDPPADLAASFMYHSFELGDDLIDASAMTFGVQASKRFGEGWAVIEPYAGLSYDFFQMDVSYESTDDIAIDLSFDSQSTAHLTLGLNAMLSAVSLYGEYNLASQSGFAFGLGIGM